MNTQELYCILNAAEGQLDVLLATQETILSAQSWYAPTRGAEILTPALQGLLDIQKLKPEHIRHFACVHGPGSFTGIRLVMGTVAALRRVVGADNASIDYMQALALTAQQVVQEAGHASSQIQGQVLPCIAVLTHARRNLVHAQFFTVNFAGMPQSHGDAILCSPETACTQVTALAAQGHAVYMLGSGLGRNASSVQKCLEAAQGSGVHAMSLVHPSPKALWQMALQATYENTDLSPLYIRPCDAVENLNHIATKQGMDPSWAHAKLAEILTKEVSES